MFTVATFYCFKHVSEPERFQAALLRGGEDLGIRGLLIAGRQGINGTVAGLPDHVDAFVTVVEKNLGTNIDNVKRSRASRIPFKRMGVRLSEELITFGQPDADPVVSEPGTYVDPGDWNRLIDDDDVFLIDARNDYETKTGSFEGAVDPQIETFSEFAAYVDAHLSPEKTPRIAMFCTGGIRCEVASTYLLNRGFQQVYHLRGGILKYLEEVVPSESKWNGECFVFDQRVTVDHNLEQGSYTLCNACSWPTPRDTQEQFSNGATCAHCDGELSAKHRERAAERWRQKNLQQQRLAAGTHEP